MSSVHRRLRLRRHHLITIFFIGLIVASITAASCASSSDGEPAATESVPTIDPVIAIDPPIAIGDFELTDSRGAPYRFSEGEGDVRLFYFGYTDCPDICPATMVDWRNARRALGDRADHVRFLMVTVDPENDTPEALAEYLGNFDPTFVGLSGTEAELRRAWDAFGVKVQKVDLPESATAHSISHSASVFVVNRDEELVMRLAFDATDEDIVKGVLELLEESGEERGS
jgi:protein SCO1/2